MDLTKLPEKPSLPEIIEAEFRLSDGNDLLGLRLPAEIISNGQLDGITTVTPTVRYFSIISWMIKRYFELKGQDNYACFYQFAKKIETAVVVGNILQNKQVQQLVGIREAVHKINSEKEAISLSGLVKNHAINIYYRSALNLGFLSDRENVPGLYKERGKPLSDAVDSLLKDIDFLQKINTKDEIQDVHRDELMAFGSTFPMGKPANEELKYLIEGILPSNPGRNEFPRLRTYCLLLYLTDRKKRIIDENDIFTEISRPTLDGLPNGLKPAFDLWVKFVVRDMIVAVHEASVYWVGDYLRNSGGRISWEKVINDMASNLDNGLNALGFKEIGPDSAISVFYKKVTNQLGDLNQKGEMLRWNGKISENAVAKAANFSSDFPSMAILLPLAWIIAVQRFSLCKNKEDAADFTRIGLSSVIKPAVDCWQTSSATILETVQELLKRSVEQHFRIAWSRYASDPSKDVAVLSSDNEEWIFIKLLSSGRANSRLYQCINWLKQLRLVTPDGITEEAKLLLSDRIKLIEQGWPA